MGLGTTHHLRVAQEANAAAYRHLVQTSVPGECWDLLVLTAANQKQADGYRAELALRERHIGTAGAFFPAVQKSIVVADPPGRRAGSGGATLGVLNALQAQLGISLAQLSALRILLIHSGGASQRLPMYSPVGKIFSPLPLLRPDGQIATLFDHLYVTLCGLPDRLGPGMLVVAGDVFLMLDHRHLTTPGKGVTAITMRVPAEMGRGHGVFVTDAAGRIRSTLQKVSVEAMQQQGATDSAGAVLIDTGILFFDAGATARLGKLAGMRPGKVPAKGLQDQFPGPIDLYEDMTLALAADALQRDYLQQGNAAVRRKLWTALHGLPFSSVEVAGEFLHLGTTRQFRDAMTGRNPSPAADLLQQNVLAHTQWALSVGPRVFHSALLRSSATPAELGEGSVVEHSILDAPCTIGKDCVVSQTIAMRQKLSLPDDMLFFQVPVKLQRKPLYVQVLCGTADDFKGRYDEGECLYLNAPIQQWMQRHDVTPADLWGRLPSAARKLWNARIFPATAVRDACEAAMWLSSPRRASAAVLRKWRSSPRFSMAMVLESVDAAGLIEYREVVAASLQAGRMLERIRLSEMVPADVLLNYHTTPGAYREACGRLQAFAVAPTHDPQQALQQARAWWTIAQVASRPSNPDPSARSQIAPAMSEAFGRVAWASELGQRQAETGRVIPRPLPLGTMVEALSPVRLDLTGGWTDTPPYCYEEGGHVINVAIDLDGRPPVRATVQRVRGNTITIDSRDLGRTLTATPDELRRRAAEPHDPFALQRLALELTGFLDCRPVGLHVTTECRVPKGSGLGTSSILAATLIAALLRAGGHEPLTEDLIQLTLLLEQRLSTGGGWQDQVGGIVGGIKSTLSSPGVPQRPIVEQLAIPSEQMCAFEQRLVVYFSGQQRLARDILRRVEGQWLAREPAVVLLKRELKTSAAAMRLAILDGRWQTVADEIARYWRIKKQLYPGSTTPSIDVLLLQTQEQYLAASLAGAGGGGFGYFLCRDEDQACRLRNMLATPGFAGTTLGSVYETHINRSGLRIGVKRA